MFVFSITVFTLDIASSSTIVSLKIIIVVIPSFVDKTTLSPFSNITVVIEIQGELTSFPVVIEETTLVLSIFVTSDCANESLSSVDISESSVKLYDVLSWIVFPVFSDIALRRSLSDVFVSSCFKVMFNVFVGSGSGSEASSIFESSTSRFKFVSFVSFNLSSAVEAVPSPSTSIFISIYTPGSIISILFVSYELPVVWLTAYTMS